MNRVEGLRHRARITPQPQRQEPPSPQRLTAAEEAVWFSDRRGDPRVVVLLARLSAHLDPGVLCEAISELVLQRPLLSCHPATPSGLARRHYWQPEPLPGKRYLTVESGGDTVVAALTERLRAAVAPMTPGFAVGLVKQLADDVLILVVHHALTDGVGALGLLAELAAGAKRAQAGEGAATPPDSAPAADRAGADVDELVDPRRRGAQPYPLPAHPHRPPRVSLAPSRLARQAGSGSRSGSEFGFAHLGLTLGKATPPYTVNDVIIAATIIAVDRWNSGRSRRTGRITVHMPINRRVAAPQLGNGQLGVIGNETGQAVIVAGADERVDGRVLGVVHRQTQAAKLMTHGHPGPAERTVGALLWMPARLRQGLLGLASRCLAGWAMPTITVSNLGRVGAHLPTGEAGLEGIEQLVFLTTAGMPQGITVTASGLRGTVYLAISFSRALFTDSAAREFLALIAEGLDQLTQPAG